MEEGYDVIVVGQGLMGSAALWQCSQRGAKCLGVEQFSFPHTRGSSHGSTRIIRSLYPEKHYAKLVNQAFPLWYDLEKETNTELIIESGGIDFAPRNSHTFHELLSTCEDQKIPYEILDSEEVAERFPGFSTPADYGTVYTKRAGVIQASKSVLAMQKQAIKNGSHVIDNMELKSVSSSKGSVCITLEDKRKGKGNQLIKVTCKKLIISPGGWLTPLTQKLFDIKVHSQVLQMGYYYFNTLGNDKNLYDVSRFPVFIDYANHERHIYGTPAYEYPGLLKVGAHGTAFDTHITTATTRTFSPVPELIKFAQEKVQLHFPKADWRNPVHTESCLYTWTRDAEFLLDFVPENPDIIMAGGGSGHAFKHGSAIGSILADMALHGNAGEWAIPQFQFPFHTVGKSKL